MKKIRTLFVCSFIINEVFLKGNTQSAYFGVKNLLLHKNEYAKQETPTYFIRYINDNFNKIVKYDDSFILVDFGCGDGSTLKMLTISKKKIGIEIDESICKMALHKCKDTSIRIINDDILNYGFKSNTILYMYEPLWLCKDYKEIYEKLLHKISKSRKKVYIIYLTGLNEKINNFTFKKFGYNLIHKHKHGSILLNRSLNVYSN